MLRLRLAIIAALALLGPAAAAATYYVSPRGDDANEGTIVKPFRTIARGVSRLQTGDQLLVRGGVYRETVTLWELAGTSERPIVISGYPHEKAVIDGRDRAANGVVVIGNSRHVRFEQFEVRNGVNSGIYIFNSSDIAVRDNHVHHCGAAGINATSAEPAPFGTTHDITISGNTVYENVRNKSEEAGWQQGISAYRADRVTISGNFVYQNHGEGIDYIASDNGTITGNKLWDNFSINLYLDNAQSTRVDGNFIECTPKAAFQRGGKPPAGIGAANEHYREQNPLRDLAITNNIVLRCLSGFSYDDAQFGGGLRDTLLAHNVFYATEYATLWIAGERHDSVTIANNILVQYGGRPFAVVPRRGIAFRTNNWHGTGDRSTIAAGDDDVRGDPHFVRAGGGDDGDYRLSPESPLIDAGTLLEAIPYDYFGTRRDPKPDIGVHEF